MLLVLNLVVGKKALCLFTVFADMFEQCLVSVHRCAVHQELPAQTGQLNFLDKRETVQTRPSLFLHFA